MDFRVSMRRNSFKTFYLIFSLFILLSISVTVAGAYIGLPYKTIFPIALLFSFVSTGLSYWNSDKLVILATKARVITHEDAPQLFNLVEEITLSAGLPLPKIAIVNDPAPNAFATGRNPENSLIAFTTGILEKMDREELQGVAAHELSHIKNYDTLVSTIAAVTAGAIILISDFFRRILFYSGGRGSKKTNPFQLIALIAVIILAPIGALLLKSAISRKRETLADSTAVAITRNPTGLKNALIKLRDDSTVVAADYNALSHLYIESPLENRSNFLGKLFDTHPPIEDRIRNLEEMGG